MSGQKTTAFLAGFLFPRIFLVGCGSGGSGEPSIASIAISSPQSSIAGSGADQFTATAVDRRGNPILGVTCGWTSSATNIAPINSSGDATGMFPGATQITVSDDGITGNQLTLTVSPGFS
jgi:hypothetical protein